MTPSFARFVVALAPALALTCLTPGCSDGTKLPPAEQSEPTPDAGGSTAEASVRAPFVDLGDVPVNQSVTFEIKPGALGFNLTVTGPEGARIGVKRLIGPDGVAVVKNFTVEGATRKTTENTSGVACAQVPSTDARFIPGTWTAVFDGPDGAALRAGVRIQYSKDGQFHGGLLDAHVWIPDGLAVHDPSDAHAIDAGAAADDDAVQARLESYFKTIEELFELDRGEVTYHALPPSFLVIETADQLRALNRATAVVPPGPGVHLMFVQRLAFANSADPFTWAISSGLPGAAWLTGSALSGVALSNDEMTNAVNDGITLAHETGHFFGLMHTTEFSGDDFDPLADTPECAKMGTTRDVFSRCPDAWNLMFPALPSLSADPKDFSLSETQRRIVHGSPIYRPR